MPRRARISFANIPHHIVQRGHCRKDVFQCDFDRLDYLATLAECRENLQFKLFAYCLMSNHVHLIIDPGNDATTISALMKRLAGRHARRLNLRNSWSGSIWESRFKCSPIETDRYLLTCGRYVDLNPVRAGIVRTPEEFAWSSYRARAGIDSCAWLDPDPAIESLAATDTRRRTRYRELVAQSLDEGELALIRGALQRNQLTATRDFAEKINRDHGLFVPNRSRGRPRRARHRPE
ncbi:MAG TPA: transposase [Steroidobacteraceae bacterium]|nr:transposase [Steroidobacteraceae bacterium]